MALNVDKTEQKKIVSVPQQQSKGTETVSGSKTSQPVDVKEQPKTNENKTTQEILDYINSLDQSLPQAKKIKLIKERFPALQGAKKDDIRNYINLAAANKKSEATETAKTTDTAAKTETKTTTDETTSTSNAASSEQSTSSEDKTNLKSESKPSDDSDEILKYADKIGFKGTVDDLRTHLLSLKKQNKLDEEGLKILKQFETNSSQETKDEQVIPPLVTEEELDSPEWKNKSVQEKTDVYMELYLAKNDEKYASLSPKAQKEYREKELNKLSKELRIKLNKGDAHNKATEFSKLIDTLEALNKQKMSIDSFVNIKDKSAKSQLINKTNRDSAVQVLYNKVNHIKELIPEEKRNSEEWKKLSSEDKLNIYFDALCEKKYPDYSKMTDKQKAAFRHNKTDEILDYVFGSSLSSTIIGHGKEKNNIKKIAAQSLELAEKGELTEAKFKSITYKVYSSAEMDEETMTAFKNLMEANSDKSPTEIRNLINNDKTLTPSQKRKIQRTLDAVHQLDPKTKLHEIVDYQRVAKQNNCDSVQDLISKTITKKTKITDIEKMAQNVNGEEFDFLVNHLKKAGFSKTFIQNLGKTRNLAIGLAMTNNDGAAAECEVYRQSEVCQVPRENVLQTTKTIFEGVTFDAQKAYALSGVSRGIKKVTDTITTVMNQVNTTEENIEIMQTVDKSDEVSDSAKAIAAESIIKTAPSDDTRVELNKGLCASVQSESFLEGLAAGSKYVTSDNAKTEYTSYVQTAASNYSPEVQTTINTALQTGKVSQKTLSRTTPPKYYDSYSEPSRSSGGQSSVAKGNSQPAAKSSTPQSSPQAPVSTPIAPAGSSAVAPGISNPTQSTASNILETPSISSFVSDSPVSRTYSPAETDIKPTTTSKSRATQTNVQDNTTAALEAKRDAVGEKILQYQEHVKESYIERAGKSISDEAAQTIAEIITTENISNIPEEVHEKIKQIFEQNNINTIYDIITTEFGANAQEKFIDALARYGSSEIISAFVNDKKNDSTIIKTLYLKCTNKMVKSELLNMLPEDTIHQMISDGVITNLNDIDTKILKNFLMSKGSSLSNTNFASYRKYFSLDDWTKILNERNAKKGITTKENTTGPQTVSKADNNPINDKNQTKNETASNKKQQDDNVPETQFKAGETTKTLSDGTVITNQGATFAGISNNADNNTYKVVEPKQAKKEGAPIGMNDEVLTPGSPEWLRKYNKQQEPPKTSFTMASMNEEEEEYYDDFGMPFGSNKVSIGTKINKKYPHGIKFNA